jgi:hypothetical protein
VTHRGEGTGSRPSFPEGDGRPLRPSLPARGFPSARRVTILILDPRMALVKVCTDCRAECGGRLTGSSQATDRFASGTVGPERLLRTR